MKLFKMCFSRNMVTWWTFHLQIFVLKILSMWGTKKQEEEELITRRQDSRISFLPF